MICLKSLIELLEQIILICTYSAVFFRWNNISIGMNQFNQSQIQRWIIKHKTRIL
jgi:hypothetical protein